MNRRAFIQSLAAGCAFAEQQPAPAFSFGLVSDIQYADADTTIGRDYRGSPEKLQSCVNWWNQLPISFLIELGDFVDRGPMKNVDDIAQVFNRVNAPKYYVLGNHDFFTTRDAVIARLGMPAPYYEFSRQNWRFIVLDGMNVSANGGWPDSDPHAVQGRQMLQALRDSKAVNAQPWNGALGAEQRGWLARVLSDADRRHQRAIVFCHFPVLAASCRPAHLLWDHAEVVDILKAHPSVVAFFDGHDHRGGYALDKNIHYLTFPALVEHQPGEACKTVDVYGDRLVIRSLSGADQVLLIERR
jgi:manganese-dependent ADP-ribose/CDP-alcohol diphosphatase